MPLIHSLFDFFSFRPLSLISALACCLSPPGLDTLDAAAVYEHSNQTTTEPSGVSQERGEFDETLVLEMNSSSFVHVSHNSQRLGGRFFSAIHALAALEKKHFS